MFTGLIESVGEIANLSAIDGGFSIRIQTDIAAGLRLGESVAVNGVCLTVVATRPDGLAFEIGPETLSRTTLGRARPGDAVNLERPLRFGAAVGGHLVLGHVDGMGTVEDVTRVESTARVRIALSGPALAPLLIPQGSVAVDGVSLTIAALEALAFEVMVIPHTLAATTFGRLRPGLAVNIETDVIGKYLQRSLALKGTT